jgi:hypothetical protein
VRGGKINGTATPTLSNVGLDTGGAAEALTGEKSPVPGVPEQLGGLLSGQLGKLPGQTGQPGQVPGQLGKLPGQLGTSQGLTATIPIRGTLDDPQADLLTALSDVLKTSVAEASTAQILRLGTGVPR